MNLGHVSPKKQLIFPFRQSQEKLQQSLGDPWATLLEAAWLLVQDPPLSTPWSLSKRAKS